MITKVLVANRGEIARRVFATCRRLGIGTVAVYTEPDAASPHVAEADVRVRLDGRNGYLDAVQLIDAARAAGADAIHPGYGFLSENAEFAAAVEQAGLTWIGPPVAAVQAMGSKIEAKKMMAAAGVPVLDELDPNSVTTDQLPVLIKASAGGGGRGMRVVRELAELPGQVAAASREAQSAFGDPTVFCERYLATGHHVEVQVMADEHGTVWSVGERECSIQRRHQKIIEEAPSPLVERTPGMRAKLFHAARLAAEAIGYTGAGTVEFMADDDGDFFFLEMNTRLQVEHPVTEETTGLDLVELQLHVASGGALVAEPPAARGHSIEVRLYAENPAKDWQPQAGPIHHFEVPNTGTEFTTLGRPGVRVDSGVVDGSVVSIFYDPMLAKVISYAPTRTAAAAILGDALTRTRLHGITTNRDLLVNVLRHPAFLAGATDTAFFDTHGLAGLASPAADAAASRWSAVAAALADAAHNASSATVLRGLPSGWRNLPSGYQSRRYVDASGDEHTVAYRFTRERLELADDDSVRLVSSTPARVVLADDRVERTFQVARYGDEVFVDSPLGPVRLTVQPRFPAPDSAVAQGSLLAPMSAPRRATR
jgi:acetyl/propionyl-CoA carboxylase alpha subunit